MFSRLEPNLYLGDLTGALTCGFFYIPYIPMNIRALASAVGIVLCASLSSSVRAQVADTDVAQFAQLVRNYNLVTFGDANLTFINNDTQGPLAVGGDLSVGGVPLVNFGQFANSSDPTLYVQGKLSVTNNTTAMLNNGYASLPGMAGQGSWDSTQKRYTTPSGGGILSTINAQTNPKALFDPRSNPVPASWNFATMKTNAVSISNSLAGLAATGTISVSNNALNFDAGSLTGVVVFDLDASKLNGSLYDGQSFSRLDLNISSGTEYVVNITNASGKTIFGNGINFNAPGGTAGASQLLWNVVNTGATDISVTLGNGGQFYGSVLAPTVALANATNATLNGQIIADSITYSNAELHYTGFVAIPEPATAAFFLGLVVIGFTVLIRRKFVA